MPGEARRNFLQKVLKHLYDHSREGSEPRRWLWEVIHGLEEKPKSSPPPQPKLEEPKQDPVVPPSPPARQSSAQAVRFEVTANRAVNIELTVPELRLMVKAAARVLVLWNDQGISRKNRVSSYEVIAFKDRLKEILGQADAGSMRQRVMEDFFHQASLVLEQYHQLSLAEVRPAIPYQDGDSVQRLSGKIGEYKRLLKESRVTVPSVSVNASGPSVVGPESPSKLRPGEPGRPQAMTQGKPPAIEVESATESALSPKEALHRAYENFLRERSPRSALEVFHALNVLAPGEAHHLLTNHARESELNRLLKKDGVTLSTKDLKSLKVTYREQRPASVDHLMGHRPVIKKVARRGKMQVRPRVRPAKF